MNGSMEALWEQLRQIGVVGDPVPAPAGVQTPWYVRVMLGVSGWIAAVFLLGFVAVGLEFVVRNEVAAIVVGGLALVAAYAIFRFARNDFHEQFGLAVSVAGQGLVLFGLVESLGGHGSTPWLTAAALQALVALVMPNFVQRVVAAHLAAYTLSVALALNGAPPVIPILLAFIIAIIWLNEFSWCRMGALLRPVGYGLTLALVQLQGQRLLDRSSGLFLDQPVDYLIRMPPWVGELAVGLLLIGVVGRLISHTGEPWTSRRMLLALLVTVAVTAVSLEASGIATGLLVISLGYSNGNRVLVGLGIAALLFYISAYYYTLQTTLLVKSGVLAATGAMLLLARWVVLKWVFPPEESSHA